MSDHVPDFILERMGDVARARIAAAVKDATDLVPAPFRKDLERVLWRLIVATIAASTAIR